MATAASPETRQERWRQFMSRESQERFLFLIRFSPDAFPRPWPMPDQIPGRIEWSWSRYCRMVQQTEWLDDDTLPYLDCFTGTEIFAEAFGAEVFRPERDMPYAHPVLSCARDAAKLKKPSLESPSIARMFAVADELRSRSGPDALVRIVDIQSPMDIAAILWDKNDYYAALLDEPNAVREVAAIIGEFLAEFLQEWYCRYGTRHIAHYPDYMMDGGMTLSEDEIGSVSTEIFEDLFLPELNALSDRFGGISIHCCANSRHQWDGLLKVRGLRLLNFNQPPAVVQQAYQFFGSKVVHWHSWAGDGPVETAAAQVPSQCRFIVEREVKTRDDALRLCDLLHQARQSHPLRESA